MRCAAADSYIRIVGLLPKRDLVFKQFVSFRRLVELNRARPIWKCRDAGTNRHDKASRGGATARHWRFLVTRGVQNKSRRLIWAGAFLFCSIASHFATYEVMNLVYNFKLHLWVFVTTIVALMSICAVLGYLALRSCRYKIYLFPLIIIVFITGQINAFKTLFRFWAWTVHGFAP